MIRPRLPLQYTTRCHRRPRARLRRNLLTLAIESSCDDSCVAILEKSDNPSSKKPLLQVHHHEKATSNNLAYHGIHPLEALHSHQENLAQLVSNALHRLPKAEWSDIPSSDIISLRSSDDNVHHVRKPDMVAVTRGPGMRSNLNAGLDLAKGLAVAWDRPLVGVNHMQAHALTPRLVTAMDVTANNIRPTPEFPFLSLLISGGHTLLLHSQSLTEHALFGSTIDIAIGSAIDKIARDILPDEDLQRSTSTMYGRALEHFAFPRGQEDYHYIPPATRGAEIGRYTSQTGWSLLPPLAATKSGSQAHNIQFSFSGLGSTVKRIMQSAETATNVTENSRRELATNAMRLCFEHLSIRARFALERTEGIDTLVVSGGVASNKYLREVLRKYLDSRGYQHIKLIFPPPYLCVDNAIMIGWAGIEMFEQGWRTDLSIRSLQKWSLDSSAEDGGILGANGWTKIHDRVRVS